MSIRRAWIELDRLAHHSLGVLQPSALPKEEAEPVESIEIPRLPSEDILVQPLCPRVVARAMPLPRFSEQCLAHGQFTTATAIFAARKPRLVRSLIAV